MEKVKTFDNILNAFRQILSTEVSLAFNDYTFTAELNGVFPIRKELTRWKHPDLLVDDLIQILRTNLVEDLMEAIHVADCWFQEPAQDDIASRLIRAASNEAASAELESLVSFEYDETREVLMTLRYRLNFADERFVKITAFSMELIPIDKTVDGGNVTT